MEGSEGLPEESKGLPEWSEGLPEGFEGLPEGPEGLPGGLMYERMVRWTERPNFFPFYRILPAIGASALLTSET